MLARVLAMALLSVSVTSRCSVETVERIGLLLGMGASFDLCYSVLQGNAGTFKNKNTSPWNFAPNSGLFRKFRYNISIVEASRKMNARSVINWAVVGQRS